MPAHTDISMLNGPRSGLVTPPNPDESPKPRDWYDINYRTTPVHLDLSAYNHVGQLVEMRRITHPVRGIIVDNLSGCILQINGIIYIPPNVLNFSRPTDPDVNTYNIVVYAGTVPNTQPISIIFTEAPVQPSAGVAFPTGTSQVAGGQVTVSNVSPTTIRPPRPGRTFITIKSLDGINAISLYGSDGALAMVLRPYESVNYNTTGYVEGLVAASGGASPNIAFWDYYNY